MNKEQRKLFKFCNNLITIFTGYVTILDAYFAIPENKEQHEFLYEEYKELGKRLKNLEMENRR